MAILKKIEKLVDDGRKFEQMRGRYAEYSAKIRQANAVLKEVADELDPKTITKGRTKERSEGYAAALYELNGKMNEGTLITTNLIAATYPNLNQYSLWQRLKKGEKVCLGTTNNGKHLFKKVSA